jgi:hypothetical protein
VVQGKEETEVAKPEPTSKSPHAQTKKTNKKKEVEKHTRGMNSTQNINSFMKALLAYGYIYTKSNFTSSLVYFCGTHPHSSQGSIIAMMFKIIR